MVNAKKSFLFVDAVNHYITRRIPTGLSRPDTELPRQFRFSPDGKSLLLDDGRELRISNAKWQKATAQKTAAQGVYKKCVWFDGCLSNAIISLDSPDGEISVNMSAKERAYPYEPGRVYSVILGIEVVAQKEEKTIHSLWKQNPDNPDYNEWIIWADYIGNEFFYIVTMENKGQILYIWRLSDGKRIHSIVNPFGKYVAVSADCKTAVSWSYNWDVYGSKDFWIWDITTKRLIRHFQNPDTIAAARFSPDGRILAIAGKHGTFTFWRV